MGGPISKYFIGCFREISIDYDIIHFTQNKMEYNKSIMELIENKTFDEYSYRNYKTLTPAFWIDVPENWKNKSKK